MDFDPDSALDSLSSCIRCRKQRIGCNRLLPKCQKCIDAHVECETWDHVLEEAFPRSYIYRLHERLQALNEELALSEQHFAPEGLQNPALVSESNPTHFSSQASASRMDERSDRNPAWGSILSPDQGRGSNAYTGYFTEISDHFPGTPKGHLSYHEGEMFWGPSSAFVHLDMYLGKVETPSATAQIGRGQILSFLDSPDMLEFLSKARQTLDISAPPPESLTVSFFEIFTITIETFTPIIGRELFCEDMRVWYDCHQEILVGHHADRHQACLRAQLVIAIGIRILACYHCPDASTSSSQSDIQTQLWNLSTSYFQAAASHLEVSFDNEIDPSSYPQNAEVLDISHSLRRLRFLLLLIAYVLLDPGQGNIWQLLGYAGRLRESRLLACRKGQVSVQEGNRTSRASTRSDAEFETLYNTLDCFEIEVGIAFGRPVQASIPDDSVQFRTSNMSGDFPKLFHTLCILELQIHMQFMVPSAPGEIHRYLQTQKAWYQNVESQADSWFQDWMTACVCSGDISRGSNQTSSRRPVQRDGLPDWLIKVGKMLTDKAKHLALCLLLRRSALHNLPAIPYTFTNSGLEIPKNYISSCWDLCYSSYHLEYSPDMTLDAYKGGSSAMLVGTSYDIGLVYPILCISPFDILRAAVSALWCANVANSNGPEINQGSQPRLSPESLASQIDQGLKILELMSSFQGEICAGVKLALHSLKSRI